MDEETKERIIDSISLFNFRRKATSPSYFKLIRINGALFYGPPGTGKTHLSRAIAKASEASMLVIDSTILSQWVGKTEKHIKAAFTLSARLSPCVLFIDEVDSLFYRRHANDKSWQRSALAQFLSEMDGLNRSDQSPFVLVATNRPQDMDEAFFRRLPQKIFFDLPKIESRVKILQLFLKEVDLDPSLDISDLARDTDGYSGSDLRNLCAEAALICAIEHMKVTPKGEEIHGSRLNASHFAKALKKIRPTVSEQALTDLSKFAQRFNPEAIESPKVKPQTSSPLKRKFSSTYPSINEHLGRIVPAPSSSFDVR